MRSDSSQLPQGGVRQKAEHHRGTDDWAGRRAPAYQASRNRPWRVAQVGMSPSAFIRYNPFEQIRARVPPERICSNGLNGLNALGLIPTSAGGGPPKGGTPPGNG